MESCSYSARHRELASRPLFVGCFRNSKWSFSISATSRATGGEEDGRHYYFLTESEFREEIEKDAFLEWEEVYSGVFYGTLRQEVERLWAIGKQVVFDIDVQGGLNLKAQFQNRAPALLIQPPSLKILEERLRGRGTESEEQLSIRIEKAGKEMELADRFDGIILNDDLEKAVEEALEQVRNFLLQ